ncbi:hypothetical protein DAPPUDRAFT_257969 [Daphnia pulex]|uniref:Uncharacterized protein n=1 Tax=Daphnia pulex TaxID=6669 RepID=E9HEJ6_DAPPU|nr:hypothetical protein DAPPUDRAFT_257969 [Daphnia pulex]|eukprot:EFX69857.1 hypothetical protein DAPPUDRAFT_257969 [Daphnia pulex]
MVILYLIRFPKFLQDIIMGWEIWGKTGTVQDGSGLPYHQITQKRRRVVVAKVEPSYDLVLSNPGVFASGKEAERRASFHGQVLRDDAQRGVSRRQASKLIGGSSES